MCSHLCFGWHGGSEDSRKEEGFHDFICDRSFCVSVRDMTRPSDLIKPSLPPPQQQISQLFGFRLPVLSTFFVSILPAVTKRMTIPTQNKLFILFMSQAPFTTVPFTPFDASMALTTLFSAERTAFIFAADYCQQNINKAQTVSSSIPTPQNPFSPCPTAVTSIYAAARAFFPLPIACSKSSRTSS